MKHAPPQLDIRENSASPRQHASRFAFDIRSNPIRIAPENLDEPSSAPENDTAIISSEDLPHAARQYAATEGEGELGGQLLTVREVAHMLQVPVSWVYEHIRERCADRIPGFRLGKYWRFSEEDVSAWLRAKRTKDYRHGGHSR